jgi:hypothetical protein
MNFCKLLSLPPELAIVAAQTAVKQNPANRPAVLGLAVMEPQHIALLTSKYWGPAGVHLGVTFLDTQDAALKAKILSHMNAWNQWANVQFSESTQGQVRIAMAADGYWSYLGTDISHIAAGQPTMNLEGFTVNTSDSEYKRVVRHETGHTLGFPHEHMRKEIVARIDPTKAKSYFLQNDGWDAATVQAQVLTPLDDATLTEAPTDTMSIMCYQLPGSIMVDSVAVPGGIDIDPEDGGLAAKIYPLAIIPPVVNPPVNPGTGGTATAVAVKAKVDAAFVSMETQYGRFTNCPQMLKIAQPVIDAAVDATFAGQ